MTTMTMKNDILNAAITEMVDRVYTEQERLTKAQMEQAFREALESGDFMRHVHYDGQSVSYVPYRERAQLLKKIEELSNHIKELGGETPDLTWWRVETVGGGTSL